MPIYENGVIYKLKHNLDYDDLNIYIGSTTNFKNRKNGHKTFCNNEKGNAYNYPVYQFIRDNGGWTEWVMIPIEVYSCDSKKELEIRERHHIDLLRPTLNVIIPTRTHKERYQDFKEQIKKKVKEYRDNNKEQLKEKRKEYAPKYYENNKEKLKKIREDNKEKRKEYFEEYRKANREIINQKIKKYNEVNKEKVAKKKKEKVICDKCGCESTRNHLKRHQKTKKCLKSQEQDIAR